MDAVGFDLFLLAVYLGGMPLLGPGTVRECQELLDTQMCTG